MGPGGVKVGQRRVVRGDMGVDLREGLSPGWRKLGRSKRILIADLARMTLTTKRKR